MSDIALLFTVAGGGSISGESGATINQQIKSIADQIQPKIKFQIDEQSANTLQSRLKEIISSVSSIGGELTSNISGVNTSLQSITTDMNAIKQAVVSITAALPQSGSALDAMAKQGSVGIDGLLSRLIQLEGLITQINNKNFSVTNVFEYKSGSQGGSQALNLYRAQATELLNVVEMLGAEFGRLSSISNASLTAALSQSGKLNDLLILMDKYKGRDIIAGDIATSNTTGKLTTIIAQLTEYKRVYESLLYTAGQKGFKAYLPDTTGLDAAVAKVKEFEANAKMAEQSFLNAANAAAGVGQQNRPATNGSVNSVQEQTAQLQSVYNETTQLLDDLRKKILSTFDLTTVPLDTSKIKAVIDEIKAEFDNLKNSIDTLTKDSGSTGKTSGKKNSNAKRRQTEANQAATAAETAAKRESDAYIAADNASATSATSSAQKRVTASKSVENASRAATTAIKQEAAAQSSFGNDDALRADAYKKISTLQAQIASAQTKFTAAKNGITSGDYNLLGEYNTQLEALYTRVQNNTISVKDFNQQFGMLNANTKASIGNIKTAGENMQTFSQRVGGMTKKMAGWIGASQIIMYIIRGIRAMVNSVKEVDTAMTELKKVTDETDATYERFLNNATGRAKKLGAALSDTISATSDFARLGFGIEEAEKLADAAIIYKNVGDGIENINEASDSIIATMQAFGVKAGDVMTIVDKFNKVGNNFAISSKGVGDALLRSAAAMKSANNTLDETIALATAANTVVNFVPRCYGNIAA